MVSGETLGVTLDMEKYGILLVDDEPAYLGIVSALLERRGGVVEHASDRAAALAAAQSKSYDLILVDINMAGDDGYRVVSELRQAVEWARLAPILAFTAQHLTGGERHYIDAGFDGWLPKPFQAAELIVTLRHWLGADRIGPIDDRSDDRLAALLGEDGARAMIDRFHASLADAVTEVDAGGDRGAVGHRLGGLAGTLGFPVLSAAWLSLEEGEGAAWPTVRALTQEAIARHGTRRTSIG